MQADHLLEQRPATPPTRVDVPPVAHPTVAITSGFWGQNIGNAFFDIGGKWVLEQVFGAGRVAFIQNQPGYRTFNNQAKGNPRRDFGILKELDVEYIAHQGPLLTVNYRSLWAETFRALQARGTKIILLGAALFRYSDEEIRAAKAFVDEIRPVVIATRDSRTYGIVKDWAPHVHDGIDSGFFAPKVCTPFRLATPRYVTCNFDRFPEPSMDVWRADDAKRGAAPFDFEILDHRWRLQIPALQMFFAKRGKAQAYLGHLLDRRRLPETVAGCRVVRPEHRFNPHVTWKIYQHPNAVASDEPFTYFTVYANTALTLADRVHACVATLAYGKPAMLFTPSPRAALFERVGLADIKRRPVSLDPDYLEEQRQAELVFLRRALQ
jgi:hypothetical protein